MTDKENKGESAVAVRESNDPIARLIRQHGIKILYLRHQDGHPFSAVGWLSEHSGSGTWLRCAYALCRDTPHSVTTILSHVGNRELTVQVTYPPDRFSKRTARALIVKRLLGLAGPMRFGCASVEGEPEVLHVLRKLRCGIIAARRQHAAGTQGACLRLAHDVRGRWNARNRSNLAVASAPPIPTKEQERPDGAG